MEANGHRGTCSGGKCFVRFVFGWKLKSRVRPYTDVTTTDDFIDILQGEHIEVHIDSEQVFDCMIPSQPKNGFLAIGTETFAQVYFDNFWIKSATPD